jgi:hypothetical protein
MTRSIHDPRHFRSSPFGRGRWHSKDQKGAAQRDSPRCLLERQKGLRLFVVKLVAFEKENTSIKMDTVLGIQYKGGGKSAAEICPRLPF